MATSYQNRLKEIQDLKNQVQKLTPKPHEPRLRWDYDLQTGKHYASVTLMSMNKFLRLQGSGESLHDALVSMKESERG